MAKTNLPWTSSTDCDWVHVEPQSGYGDNDHIEIRADAATSPGDGTSCTVTFTATLSDGSTSATTLTVTRCQYECNCGDIEIMNKRTRNIPSTGGTYLLFSISVNGGCADSVSVSLRDAPQDVSISASTISQGTIINVSGTFGEHDSNSPRSVAIEVRIGEYCCDCGDSALTFTQSGKACDCNNLTINNSTSTVNCLEGTHTLANAYSFECSASDVPTITASSDQSWLNNVSVNGGNLTYKVNANDGASRQAIITFSVGNTSCTDANKKITITQNACECDCSSVSATIHNITANSGTYSAWTSTETGTAHTRSVLTNVSLCDNWSLSATSKPDWITIYGTTGSTIKAYPNSACTSGCTAREGTIVFSVMEGNTVKCSDKFSVNVKQNCNQTITISPSSTTLDCTGGTISFSAITSN